MKHSLKLIILASTICLGLMLCIHFAMKLTPCILRMEVSNSPTKTKSLKTPIRIHTKLIPRIQTMFQDAFLECQSVDSVVKLEACRDALNKIFLEGSSTMIIKHMKFYAYAKPLTSMEQAEKLKEEIISLLKARQFILLSDSSKISSSKTVGAHIVITPLINSQKIMLTVVLSHPLIIN